MLTSSEECAAMQKPASTFYEMACALTLPHNTYGIDMEPIRAIDILRYEAFEACPLYCREDVFDRMIADGFDRERAAKATYAIRTGRAAHSPIVLERIGVPEDIAAIAAHCLYLFPRGSGAQKLVSLCDQVLPEIPIYIGKGAADVTNAARQYLNKPEYRFAAYYEAGKTITIGDIEITPYLCDHSAFDAYMFHIACGGKTLIYSGDFRSNGRKSFSHLLHKLPQADALIIEGTTLSRASVPPKTEVDLEQLAVEAISKTDAPVFTLQAATNIDRLVSIFRAARRSGRVLIQDLYMAEVASAAGKNIPNAQTFSGVRVFITSGWNGRHELLDSKYRKAKIGRAGIAKQKFVMCVRPSMKSYLETLSEEISLDGGILFYSMWNGYKQKEDIYYNCSIQIPVSQE